VVDVARFNQVLSVKFAACYFHEPQRFIRDN